MPSWLFSPSALSNLAILPAQEADFWYVLPTGLRQLVHGTFMTAVAWCVLLADGRLLYIHADAMKKGTLRLIEVSKAGGWRTAEVKQWQRVTFDDVSVETRMLTIAVVTPTWRVNVTSKPIYNLVPPLVNETHVHGRWDEEQRRFDIALNGVFPQPDAHGIVGQSFRDHRVRDGKLDVYGVDDTLVTNGSAARMNADGILPQMTTIAQAEGAIEGVYTDYWLESMFSRDFRYSSFDFPRVAAVGARTQPLSTRAASTTSVENEDQRHRAQRKREL